MKKTSLSLLLLFPISLVFAQEQPSEKSPDEQIKVEKEYDENGNLIRFDSSYVWSWTDTTGVFGLEDLLGKDIHQFFSDSMFFGGAPFPDWHGQFYKRDQHFFDRFGQGNRDSIWIFKDDSLLNFPDMGQMMQEMMKHLERFFQSDSTSHNFWGFPGQ